MEDAIDRCIKSQPNITGLLCIDYNGLVITSKYTWNKIDNYEIKFYMT